jgi:hypothetical protein
MKNKLTFSIGILGVSLFVVTSIVGGFLIKNYDVLSQYISETYAIDTEYGLILRIYGIIPSGVLITLFCFLAARHFQISKLVKISFYGFGIFYGLATVTVGIFPCDSGCNKDLIDPSISQLIHNFAGLLTYLFVPILIIIIGLGLKKISDKHTFSLQSIIIGSMSILFVFLLISNPNSEYIGLYQRIIESAFVTWIILCAFAIKSRS